MIDTHLPLPIHIFLVLLFTNYTHSKSVLGVKIVSVRVCLSALSWEEFLQYYSDAQKGKKEIIIIMIIIIIIIIIKVMIVNAV